MDTVDDVSGITFCIVSYKIQKEMSLSASLGGGGVALMRGCLFPELSLRFSCEQNRNSKKTTQFLKLSLVSA